MKGANVLKEIQVKNFRSLKDTKIQELSPITILVGENSSGKSSFLRLFPLLKQSISKRTSGPVLWSGDVDDYVDFGSFDETVTNDGSNCIIFRFNFSICIQSHFYFANNRQNKKMDVGFEIEITSKDNKDIVSKFTLFLNSDVFNFDIINKRIQINNESDIITSKVADDTDVSSHNIYFRDSLINGRCNAFGFALPNIKEVWNEFSNIMFENQKKDNEEYNYYLMASTISLLGKQLIEKYESINPSTKKRSKKDPDFENYIKMGNFLKKEVKNNIKLQNYAKLLYVYSIFPDLDDYIISYFNNVHYIAPLRATAERYYRLRNLAVDEVDFQGKNLAIFINSLNNEQIKEFNEWTLTHFGFSVNTELSKGHLSLQIKLKNSDKSINLSDTGFGYSQVLPIITELWELSSRQKKNNWKHPIDKQLIPLVVAIEQPELHLHPAVQARLAKAFIACIKLAKDHGYQLQLIIETHSETIINYFGRAIYRKQLSPNDVSIILFEKEKNCCVTDVRNSYYDDEGLLKDWPYGFFAPEE